MKARRVFSGIQPTGTLHLGNYVGALKNWVRLQAEVESFFAVVDYHAITAPFDPAEMPGRIFDAALDVLACGIDPERCTFFVQSRVPEHTELCWIFNSLTSVGALERMTQFKEKSEQFRENINAGLFDYPVLQAADILLYKANLVPVGEDQPALSQAPRLMALNDPARKMSKSLPGSYISLADDGAAIRKKIGRAVTDVGPDPTAMSPGVKNLFTLLEEFADEATARHFHQEYAAGTLRYSELKPAVADAVVAALAPIRARREELVAHPDRVRAALDAGAERASTLARRTMDEVRHRLGLR